MHRTGRNIRDAMIMVLTLLLSIEIVVARIPVNYHNLYYLTEHLSEVPLSIDADDLSKSGKWGAYAEKVKDAREVVRKVREAGNFISKLSGTEDLISLPVGIQVGSESGDFTATLVIEEIKIFQNYTQLFVILEIDAPVLGDMPLIFYSPDVKYSAQAGIIGGSTIALLADFPVNVFDKKAMLVFKGGRPSFSRPLEEITHARIGCDGFEELNIAGEVLFSRDWIRPVPLAGDSRPKTRVQGSFQLSEITHPSELFITLDIDKFSVTGMEDFHYEVDRLTMDLSETISPDHIRNSGDVLTYETQAGPKFHRLVETGNLWKGFYAGNIEVTIPSRLTGGKHVYFSAQDLIIDQQGVSFHGSISGDNSLLQFGETSLNGWAFSIETMEVIITENINWAVQFDGLVYVPVFSESQSNREDILSSDALQYIATIDPENGYLFTSGPASEMEMDLFLAQATILPSSSFTLGYSTRDEAIVARAVINADIGINATLGEKLDINLPRIGVRALTVQNTGTPIALNTHKWEIINNAPVNLGIFEFGIDMTDRDVLTSSIVSDIPEPSARLDIQSYVQLSRSEKLSGKGGFAINGKMIENNGLKKWVNEDFRVKEVLVSGRDIVPGINYLEGSLLFYENDASYGSGFRGALTLEMNSIIKEIRSIAQFGTYVEDEVFKEYYFIDLAATFDRGAPLGGAFYLRGIGGGFYKNMKRPSSIEAFNQIAFEPLTPTFFTSRIGQSMSGINYTIDRENESFGFKASTIISSPPTTITGNMEGEKTLFNANLELGMQFKKTRNEEAQGYGLQMVYFQGIGELMGDIAVSRQIRRILSDDVLASTTGFDVDDLSMDLSTSRPGREELPIPSSAISARVLLQLNLDCPEFHGILGAYVNAGILYGQAYADMLISRSCGPEGNEGPVDWHLFFGTMANPVMLGINVPIIGDLLTVRSYFLAGNEGIPTSLPPPLDYISQFDADLIANNYGGYPGGKYPNSRSASEGTGFASGMAMRIGTPPEGLKFLFLYASLQGGLGFDVMLNRNLMSDCYENAGINGWYGRGQAWLYANAEIGADLRLGFLNFRIKAFQAAAGAMLRVEGPNPFYGTGRLDARLNLLGLINTNVKFKVTIGSSIEESLPEDCAPPESPLEIPIIENVYATSNPEGNAYPTSTAFIIETNYDLNQLINDPENANKKYQVAVPMERSITYNEDTTLDDGQIKVVDDILPKGNKANKINIVEFPLWFSIKDKALQDISYKYRYFPNSYGGTNIIVTPINTLPGDDVIIIRPKAYILHARKVGQGYMYNVDKGYVEEPVFTFNTLPEINDYRIQDEDISASYPIDGMQHFHTDEVGEGDFSQLPFVPGYWVSLNKKKAYITDNLPQGYKLIARIVDDNGLQVGETMAMERIDRDGRDIFIIAKNKSLNLERSYTLQCVYAASGEINPEIGEEMIIYQCSFRTSKFPTFKDKLASFSQSDYRYIDGDNDIYCEGDHMEFDIAAEETFGDIELKGIKRVNGNSSPVLSFHFTEKCIEMDWIAGHPPSCDLYQFFGLCADDVLPEHLQTHPSQTIEIIGVEENGITFSSDLPATIFEINKYAFQNIRAIYCGETFGPNEGNRLDCSNTLMESFCNNSYTFPLDPEAENSYPMKISYNIPFSKNENIDHEYTFIFKG